MFALFRRSAPLLVILFLVACNFPGSTPASATNAPGEVATDTPGADLTEVPVAATFTPTPEITHVMTPGEGATTQSSISDTISGDTAHQGVPNEPPGGDMYLVNLYERPFNAFTQDVFFPDLDIRTANLGLKSPWMYVTIYLYGLDPGTSTLARHYGIEIDLDVDGRGEWLIMADSPLSDDWSVAGVRAWNDTNNNVGQEIACYADPPQTTDS